jgi:ferredoxin-type protein NapF
MTTSINRSDFLQARFRGTARPLRPPWAVAEAQFVAACNQCGDCISRCPTKILRRGRGRYPSVDFQYGECLFCEDCVKACPTGALTQHEQTTPWSLTAILNTELCLAFKSVECRSCYDPCENRAIEMRHRVGAVAIPVIDATRCNGCGACHAPCPVTAIEIKHLMEAAA